MKNVEQRRSGDGLPRFDFTINIPTLILLGGLALAGVAKFDNIRHDVDVYLSQHKVLWDDYLARHPERR